MKKLLFLICLLPLCGCVTGKNVSLALKELKNDPATVDVNINTLYGTVTFHRAFPTNWVPPQPK